MMSGVYASDGAWNVTAVPGTSKTGLFASDGSINVVHSLGTSFVGAYHPCGALWVTLVVSGFHPWYAPDGSMNVTTTPYHVKGVQRVHLNAGSVGSNTSTNWFLMFFGD